MKQILAEWKKYIKEAEFVDLTSDYENKLKTNPEYKKFMDSPGETIIIPYSSGGSDNINFFNSDGSPRPKYKIAGSNNWLVKVPPEEKQNIPKQALPAQQTTDATDRREPEAIEKMGRRDQEDTLQKTTQTEPTPIKTAFFYELQIRTDRFVLNIADLVTGGREPNLYKGSPVRSDVSSAIRPTSVKIIYVSKRERPKLKEVTLEIAESVLNSSDNSQFFNTFITPAKIGAEEVSTDFTRNGSGIIFVNKKRRKLGTLTATQTANLDSSQEVYDELFRAKINPNMLRHIYSLGNVSGYSGFYIEGTGLDRGAERLTMSYEYGTSSNVNSRLGSFLWTYYTFGLAPMGEKPGGKDSELIKQAFQKAKQALASVSARISRALIKAKEQIQIQRKMLGDGPSKVEYKPNQEVK